MVKYTYTITSLQITCKLNCYYNKWFDTVLFFLTVKVGIGGFSMGAATALYSATSCALGRYGNGNPYVLNLRAVVGLSGWLPGSRYIVRNLSIESSFVRSCYLCWEWIFSRKTFPSSIHKMLFQCRCLKNKIEGSHEAARRAASLPIFLAHGTCMFLHL